MQRYPGDDISGMKRSTPSNVRQWNKTEMRTIFCHSVNTRTMFSCRVSQWCTCTSQFQQYFANIIEWITYFATSQTLSFSNSRFHHFVKFPFSCAASSHI